MTFLFWRWFPASMVVFRRFVKFRSRTVSTTGLQFPKLLIWNCQETRQGKIRIFFSLQAPGLSHITRRKVTSPNVTARWRKVPKSQNTAGTQANYESTKNANESAKATKYCAQQQKWYMNYCRMWRKSSKYCGHAEWYDFTPSDTT